MRLSSSQSVVRGFDFGGIRRGLSHSDNCWILLIAGPSLPAEFLTGPMESFVPFQPRSLALSFIKFDEERNIYSVLLANYVGLCKSQIALTVRYHFFAWESGRAAGRCPEVINLAPWEPFTDFLCSMEVSCASGIQRQGDNANQCAAEVGTPFYLMGLSSRSIRLYFLQASVLRSIRVPARSRQELTIC